MTGPGGLGRRWGWPGTRSTARTGCCWESGAQHTHQVTRETQVSKRVPGLGTARGERTEGTALEKGGSSRAVFPLQRPSPLARAPRVTHLSHCRVTRMHYGGDKAVGCGAVPWLHPNARSCTAAGPQHRAAGRAGRGSGARVLLWGPGYGSAVLRRRV